MVTLWRAAREKVRKKYGKSPKTDFRTFSVLFYLEFQHLMPIFEPANQKIDDHGKLSGSHFCLMHALPCAAVSLDVG